MGKGRRRWARGGDNCSWAYGVDRQLNALSNDVLHDLVEGVLTCCSSTGSDLKLHLFDGAVIFEIVDWKVRPLDALF